MTRHFARKFQTLSVVAMFVACIGALTVVAAPAIAQNPVPFVDQPLVPDATAPGGAGFTLTVNGAWFVSASVVNWNGSPRATTFVSNHQLTAAILASDIATASSAAVTVVNPGPGGGVSNTQYLSIAVADESVSFLPAAKYYAGGTTWATGADEFVSVAVADVNGDGIPDLLGTGQECCEGVAAVLLGNGNGTFGMGVNYSVGGRIPLSIAVADVNGDGKPDLIVAGEGGAAGGFVSVLLGNGNGTFQPAVSYDTGASGTSSVAVADVNRDGKPDLLVGNAGSVSVLLGNGDGTFQAPAIYSSGGTNYGESGSLVLADFNGDGKLDVAVTNQLGEANGEGTVGVLLGNGDGTFQPAVTYNTGGDWAISIAVADLNGDGKPDLIVGGDCSAWNQQGFCYGPGSVGVLLGNGDGTFQPAASYSFAGLSYFSVASADVNGDGKLDLLALGCPSTSGSASFSYCGGPLDASLEVMLGNGDGTFQPPVLFDAGGTFPSSIAIADFSGDGRPDAAAVVGPTAGGPLQSVAVLLNGGGSTAPTTATLAPSSLNPSVFGQAVTFTAAVSSASGTPTGTVLFYDGVNNPGNPALVNGSASISVSSLTARSHSIYAAYQASGNFGYSTAGPLTQVVNSATTSIALASSANPAPVNQRVTYTATVTSQFGGAATGGVTFQDGGVTFGENGVSNNQTSWTTSYSKPGIHSITATYSGDGDNGGSISSVLMEEIGSVPYRSTTAVTTSGSPSLVGQPVIFTAIVRSSDGAIPNGELVTFYDGTTVMGTRTTVGGVATFTTSSLTAKTHTIKATYSGDATFLASSGTVTQVVNKYTTTTALLSSLNPSNYGQAVTLTATVTPTGPYQPTGTVTFRNGSVILGSKTLNASGVASLTTAKIPVGVDTLTATYNGDAFNGKSVSAAITQTVSQASISMVLTSYPNPSTAGKSVKFTAKLTSNGGLPSGQPVTFSYNGATLGTANVNSTGVATFYTTTLPRGSDLVTAAYAGTVDYSAASANVTQVVN